MDEETLAYAAGFLDGEGCFTLGKNWKIVIACENTYKPIIEWLHKQFGGSLTLNRTQRKSNHRVTYRWCVVSKDALNVCRIITPYLKEKAPQAALLIAIQQTMGREYPLSQETKDERNRLASILKGLKHVAWN